MRSITDIYSRIIEPLYEFPERVRIISDILGDSSQEVYSAARAHCFGLKWIIKGQVGHALLLSESGEQEICVNIRKMMAISNLPGSDKISEMIDEQRLIEQKMAIQRAYAMEMYSLGDNFDKFIEQASDSYIYGLLSKNNLTSAQPSQHSTDRCDVEDIDKIYLAIAIGNDDEFNLDFDSECPVFKEVGAKCVPATTNENAPGRISMVITIMADGPSPSPFLIFGGIRIILKYLQVLIEQAGVKIVANGPRWKMKDPVDRVTAHKFRRYFRKLLRRLAERARNEIIGGKLSIAARRELIVQAAYDACQQSCVATNRQAAFFSTGLLSRSFQKAFQLIYIVDDFAAPRRPEGRKTSRKTASARNLTKDLYPDKIKRKRSCQEVQNGNKIRRLNSAESRSQKRVSKQLQEEKNNEVDSAE
ncbi:MAG: hypothetical protein EZS28_012819 [Streblomastix strix]|uniref:Uncharacterized protein n=1 Tax=Streblomastix strix TaxID=222440 RepID=A0A5J4W9Q7_9EUKA|nr:MAG: hypothetical protein EZS28_012819 [Streblomastix strix]